MAPPRAWRRLRWNWQGLGERDPLWAILTDPDKRGGRWNIDEFLQTGREEIDAAMAELDHRHGLARHHRALDFGCGVGRLTLALARHFDTVDGIDIAPAMIERARTLVGDAACHYHLSAGNDLREFADGTFDLIYSSITLQHMPPELVLSYLAEFGRVLAAGGLLHFQLPLPPRADTPSPRQRLHRIGGRLRRRAFLLWNRSLCRRPFMDMYGVAQADVEAALRHAGLTLLAVDTDDSAGPHWRSRRYTALLPSSEQL